jgi:hypothetical protein
VKWFLLLAATLLEAQSIKPDTRVLAATLKAARAAEKDLLQYPAIRRSFLAWVDVRLKNPEQIDELNRELRRAGLSGPGRDEFWGADYVGLLEIAAVPLPSAPDLFAVRLGVGVPIDYDQTIVLYQRQPWRRIGWMNHEFTEEYSLFSSIAVSQKDAAGQRLIVSCGYAIERRYNGPFPVKLRIDALDGVSLKMLLNQEATAEYNYVPGKEGIEDLFVGCSVEGTIATFHYTRRLRDESYAPAILRCNVSGANVTRIAPIAITRTGFIDEWIRLDPSEAAHWSAPEALAGHRSINEFLKLHENDDHFYFEKISLCGNSPRTWQISAASAFNAPTKKWFFILSESGAANLRMLSVEHEPRPGCVEYDLGTLNEELPQP